MKRDYTRLVSIMPFCMCSKLRLWQALGPFCFVLEVGLATYRVSDSSKVLIEKLKAALGVTEREIFRLAAAYQPK